MMKVAVSSYSFSQAYRDGRLTLKDSIAKAKEMGFDGFEFVDFNVTSTKTIPFFTTDAAIKCYTLTFDDEDVSDFADGLTSAEHFNGDKKGTVSGNVYKYDGTNYSLDPDAVVYVKDGSDWSVEKAAYLAKTGEFFSDIYLFQPAADKLYNIVVVVVR